MGTACIELEIKASGILMTQLTIKAGQHATP